MKIISSLSDMVYNIEKFLSVLMVALILMSLSTGVLFRYIFDSPLSWTDEMAMFSLAWLTYIAGSMTIKAKAAPTIDILTDHLRGGTRKAVEVICNLLVFLFLAYILYISILWISTPNILIQKSGSMGMPMLYPYLSPLGFGFMTIHSLDLLLKSTFRSVKRD